MVVVALFAVASPSTAQQGPARWEKPVLTVAIADRAAWSGTDVAAALEQWRPAFAMVLTQGPDADITLEVGIASDSAEHEGSEMVGATASKEMDGSRITHCRVGMAQRASGSDQTAILTHELGHCLGLGHTSGVDGGSVMHWFARDYQGGWSDTVTPADLARVRGLYR